MRTMMTWMMVIMMTLPVPVVVHRLLHGRVVEQGPLGHPRLVTLQDLDGEVPGDVVVPLDRQPFLLAELYLHRAALGVDVGPVQCLHHPLGVVDTLKLGHGLQQKTPI